MLIGYEILSMKIMHSLSVKKTRQLPDFENIFSVFRAFDNYQLQSRASTKIHLGDVKDFVN